MPLSLFLTHTLNSYTYLMTEVWLRGPLKDTPTLVQPVAHALMQSREEVTLYLKDLDEAELWARPGGAASVAFHLQHLSGVLDRLFTYARGDGLSETQLAILKAEGEQDNTLTIEDLLESLSDQVDSALAHLRTVDPSTLKETRYVGRKKVPSTLLGLYTHAAEHTMRHVGQLLVTVKILSHKNLIQPVEAGDQLTETSYSINSFDDNDLALLESPHTTLPVPRSFLPSGCKEGDMLIVREQQDNGSSQLSFTLDADSTRNRLETARALRNNLKRAPSGDIEL